MAFNLCRLSKKDQAWIARSLASFLYHLLVIFHHPFSERLDSSSKAILHSCDLEEKFPKEARFFLWYGYNNGAKDSFYLLFQMHFLLFPPPDQRDHPPKKKKKSGGGNKRDPGAKLCSADMITCVTVNSTSVINRKKHLFFWAEGVDGDFSSACRGGASFLVHLDSLKKVAFSGEKMFTFQQLRVYRDKKRTCQRSLWPK